MYRHVYSPEIRAVAILIQHQLCSHCYSSNNLSHTLHNSRSIIIIKNMHVDTILWIFRETVVVIKFKFC